MPPLLELENLNQKKLGILELESNYGIFFKIFVRSIQVPRSMVGEQTFANQLFRFSASITDLSYSSQNTIDRIIWVFFLFIQYYQQQDTFVQKKKLQHLESGNSSCEGIQYFFKPNFFKYLSLRFWVDAVNQVIFQMNFGLANLCLYDSYEEVDSEIFEEKEVGIE
ncbi:unnamed protein product (macronuclear) [Paramecium tetraurelia]|uniref:Transmembrane protein n=1 Tax=Paramecium tetraurelia TaxID=5888 RepID=A0DR62_PARTE|nr:uncharacterized protein GSPATT00019246001 [Paramecium tetraurelia]CAK85529.1 unnamed protein product [Paramecium tetraurelia]|eukprot:XP_001452926.1 hypothetical protein (macronuclear) [Paramecium tetraurelia strain d4-2]